MSDVSKDQKGWKNVKAVAEKRLSALGGAMAWSPVAHEVMRWEHKDLVLIFYPHRTTAGNYHIRVRAGRCTDRKLLRKCIHALAENSCQFRFPTETQLHSEGVDLALKENRPFTQ